LPLDRCRPAEGGARRRFIDARFACATVVDGGDTMNDDGPRQASRTPLPVPRLWDISPPVRTGVPIFPEDTPYEQRWTLTVGPECPVNLSRITLSPHAGAHADAPLHFDPAGEAAGALDLDPFLGPCLVVHTLGEPFVEVRHLEPHAGRLEPRILVRSYARRPADRFDHHLPAFRPAALEWLADRGVRLVGTDSASVDPAASKTLDAHQVLRRRGLRVLENLQLDDIPEGRYELIALPLKLTEAEAAPVRAVLREVPR
jgi:arylformamidase